MRSLCGRCQMAVRMMMAHTKSAATGVLRVAGHRFLFGSDDSNPPQITEHHTQTLAALRPHEHRRTVSAGRRTILPVEAETFARTTAQRYAGPLLARDLLQRRAGRLTITVLDSRYGITPALTALA